MIPHQDRLQVETVADLPCFVAKQTAVVGRVIFLQRGLSIRGMAFPTKFFRFLLSAHCLKAGMLRIMWKFCRGFFRGI